ncbi:putative lipid II flippase FtsW, partial [Rhodococcus aerolatus]
MTATRSRRAPRGVVRRAVGELGAGRTSVTGWLARPLSSLHLVLAVFALLTLLGLVMVLSASSVEAFSVDGSAYSLFARQVIFAVLGLALFYLGLRTPVRVLKRAAAPALVVAVVLLVLVLVPGIGYLSNGSRSWFVLGPVSFQPAEAAKVAFALWGAQLLASRRPGPVTRARDLVVPLVPVAMLLGTLILVQPDLGTTVSLVIIVLALLWFAGLPLRWFAAVAGAGVGGALALGLSASYRADRITSFLHPELDPQGAGYQATQARYSLADGGWFGVGLGQSRAKWNYLPNAHNDFIFAILGEELGFVGAVAVIGLFALLTYVGLRIAGRVLDPFLSLLVSTCTVWLLAQALINIGYVVGLLPVTGLQLPMVSSGGTSTALTMLVFGLLANAARHEPDAISAVEVHGEGRLARALRL